MSNAITKPLPVNSLIDSIIHDPSLQNIAILREMGFNVKLGHKRWLKHFDSTDIKHTALRQQVDEYLILNNKKNLQWSSEIVRINLQRRIYPKGGETHLLITSPCGKCFSEQLVVCSLKDTFNRPLGLKIALERALSDMLSQVILEQNL